MGEGPGMRAALVNDSMSNHSGTTRSNDIQGCKTIMAEQDCDNPYKSPETLERVTKRKRPASSRWLSIPRASFYCSLGGIVTKFIALSYADKAMQAASKGKLLVFENNAKVADRLEILVMALLAGSLAFAIPAVLRGNGLSRIIVLLACFAAIFFSFLTV
jgi:hypothetical protein